MSININSYINVCKEKDLDWREPSVSHNYQCVTRAIFTNVINEIDPNMQLTSDDICDMNLSRAVVLVAVLLNSRIVELENKIEELSK